MIQLLPLITGLLQDKQKQAEQSKQAEMAAYMGQPPSQPQGDSKSGLLNGAMGLLQGIGGGDKGPATDLGSPRYNDPTPSFGGGGLSKGTTSYLDDTFGAPGSANEDELL